MTRISTLSAAFALLVSSTALAQTNTPMGAEPPPPAVDQMAPSAETPLMPGAMGPGEMGPGNEPGREQAQGPDDMMDHDMDSEEAMGSYAEGGMHGSDRRAGHRGMRGHHGMHGKRHWRQHHRGMGWDDGNEGAVFRFQQQGGPSFRIKCADGDTTLECASAIMPLLDRLMPAQPAGPAGQ